MRTCLIIALLGVLLLPLAAVAQETAPEPSAEDLFAQRYFEAMMRYNPNDLPSTYELACCLGAQGDAVRAALYLEQAIELGFDDLWSVDRSVDFEPVRDTPEFQAVIDRLVQLLAEREESYGILRFQQAHASLPYRMQLPADYDGNSAVPLVIGLHGFAGNADWFGTLWHTFENPGFIYVAPQAPYGVPNAGDVGFSWAVLRHEDDETYADTLDLSAVNVMNLITELEQDYRISEIYLLGFSQGGILAYNLALQQQHIQGIACFGSRLDSNAIPLGNLPQLSDQFRVFIAHGTDDEAVPASKGREAFEAFDDAGYDVTWLEFDDGHTLPADALREFQAWLEMH